MKEFDIDKPIDLTSELEFSEEEERELFEFLLAGRDYMSTNEPHSTRKCFNKKVILAYIENVLSDDQKMVIDEHIKDCNRCTALLKQILAIRAAKEETEIDIGIPFLLCEVKQQDQISLDVLLIVLKVKDKILDLIRTTGEALLGVPQLSAARGHREQQKDLISIRKDLNELDLSVEVTIRKEETLSSSTILVSLMIKSSEMFVKNAEVVLEGGLSLSLECHTDENGIAEFHGIQPGSYRIQYSQRDIVMLSIE